MNDLYPSWQAAWAAAGLAEPPRECFEDVRQRYAEPHRHYHTQQHLSECLGQADRIAQLAEHPGEVLIALWFHDAVYDIRRHDNEERSAVWARDVFTKAGGDAAAADRVYQLIKATEHRAVPVTHDSQVLVDVDLSILGAEAARFDEYEQQVRAEYRHVPGFLFRRKRRAVLEAFLQRPRIFSTEVYANWLEARARENLRRSITQLGG
ncbi:MAG: N-methyl-D-aspartate receptor NMDAR2C subunit [Rhizobacter sp.]